jgi:phenylacetate-CoA ligase
MDLERIYRASPVWLQGLLLNAEAARIWRHRYGHQWERRVKHILNSETWSPEERREFQDRQLRAILKASSRSPYYRELYRTLGINPEDIRNVEDIVRLPLLDKPTVREQGDALLTAPVPQQHWLHGHTSGTTGSPLGLWYDRETCWQTNAVDQRQKIWAGMTGREWLGVLLGRIVVPLKQRRPPYWRANHVHKQVWFSSFHMSSENLPLYVSEIRRRGLRFLEGYPSTLYILASQVLSRRDRLPMQAVLTSSETLHQIQRDTIEKAFECQIFDFYGLAERVAFAGECQSHDGLHLAEEFAYIEVVDDEGQVVPDGTPGFLVGTSLHNRAMPMIRYRTSDVTSIRTDPCPCGRTLRRIEPIRTKAEDVVVTPDGRMISPSVLTHPFKPLESVTKSQIIQEQLDWIRVLVVSGSAALPEAERSHLLTALRDRLGDGIRVEIEEVDDITPEPSGKFRWVISRVPNPIGLDWSQLDRN